LNSLPVFTEVKTGNEHQKTLLLVDFDVAATRRWFCSFSSGRTAKMRADEKLAIVSQSDTTLIRPTTTCGRPVAFILPYSRICNLSGPVRAVPLGQTVPKTYGVLPSPPII